MYVCVCKGITQKQVEEAVASRKGQSCKDVMKALGVGSDCGICIEEAVEQVLQSANKSPRRQHSSQKATTCSQRD